MAATEPGQVIDQFLKLFNSGEIESLMRELYEDDAVLVPEPGPATASGKAAIRDVLRGFLDMKGTLQVLATTAVVNGDIALMHTRGRLDVPGGEPMESVTAVVVRRQPDGTWKYSIDNPWGGSLLDAVG
jgi:uncharacterized protein (TIGR02246 family)